MQKNKKMRKHGRQIIKYRLLIFYNNDPTPNITKNTQFKSNPKFILTLCRIKEEKEDKDDEEELDSKRRMDEYKDEHKRGEGNRHNRA